MPRPLPLLFAALLALPVGGRPTGAAPAMPTGAPATMSVEVVSLRQGKPWRRTLAKVRPGDSVLLRDETSVPYVRAADSRGTRTESLESGLVATVVPRVREGRLRLDLVTTVREVAGYDTARVPVPGKPDAVITLPSLRERTFEASVEPAFAGGEWRIVQALGDSGYGLSIVARPLAAQAGASAGTGRR